MGDEPPSYTSRYERRVNSWSWFDCRRGGRYHLVEERPRDSILLALRGCHLRRCRVGPFRDFRHRVRASGGGHGGECDRRGPTHWMGGDLGGSDIQSRNRSSHPDVRVAGYVCGAVHDRHRRRTPNGPRPRIPCFHRGRADLGPRRRQANASGGETVGMSALGSKVALVTGSSRGIGAAIARVFAQNGAQVAVHGRDVAALSAVRESIERSGGRAIQVLADTTKDGWHASVEGNLTATFLTIKSILPGMKERKAGNIITISSSAGRRPHPRSPIPYAAAKAGIQILTQDLAAQVGPFGIRVNCIAPETILTDRNKERIPETQRQMLIDAHPIRRLGMP